MNIQPPGVEMGQMAKNWGSKRNGCIVAHLPSPFIITKPAKTAEMICIMKDGFSGGASSAKHKKKKACQTILNFDGEVIRSSCDHYQLIPFSVFSFRFSVKRRKIIK